jgi:hypothetical protein
MSNWMCLYYNPQGCVALIVLYLSPSCQSVLRIRVASAAEPFYLPKDESLLQGRSHSRCPSLRCDSSCNTCTGRPGPPFRRSRVRTLLCGRRARCRLETRGKQTKKRTRKQTTKANEASARARSQSQKLPWPCTRTAGFCWAEAASRASDKQANRQRTQAPFERENSPAGVNADHRPKVRLILASCRTAVLCLVFSSIFAFAFPFASELGLVLFCSN